jgi:hypothetical protein
MPDKAGTVTDMVSQADFDALVRRVEALEKAANLPAVVGDNTPATSGKKPRGTRMPPDFMPSMETIEQMIAEFPTVSKAEWSREHLKFKDYWNGVSTQRGVKLDWEGTWRNWMRKAFERRHPAENGGMSKVDTKAAGYLE